MNVDVKKGKKLSSTSSKTMNTLPNGFLTRDLCFYVQFKNETSGGTWSADEREGSVAQREVSGQKFATNGALRKPSSVTAWTGSGSAGTQKPMSLH